MGRTFSRLGAVWRGWRRVFFNDWEGILRVVVVGAGAYVALVLVLRVSGKRTLAKLNAFDLVVTVALGSTLATVLLSRDVPLAEGIAAFMVLSLLQYVVTWSSVRSGRIRRLVRSESALLFHQGEFLHGAMDTQRVTEQEIHQALRSEGIGSMEDVAAVVLETDGSFSILRKASTGPASTLQDVAWPGNGPPGGA